MKTKTMEEIRFPKYNKAFVKADSDLIKERARWLGTRDREEFSMLKSDETDAYLNKNAHDYFYYFYEDYLFENETHKQILADVFHIVYVVSVAQVNQPGLGWTFIE